LVRAIAGHSGPALSVGVSPDGQLLFSSGSDGKIKIWNLHTGEPLDILSGHRGGAGAVALSPDGQLLASGGYDGAVKIWIKIWKKEGMEEPVTSYPEGERPTGPPLYPPSLDSPHGLDPAPGRPPDLPD